MMAMFDDGARAVSFALAYHETLRTLEPPLVARTGVHVGPVVVHQNPADHVERGAKRVEVDGLALAVTARVQGIATGGQTLLSSAARQALSTTEFAFATHGHWQLKGLEEPIEVFEVRLEDTDAPAPSDGPKAWRVVWNGEVWIPARQIPHALPAERDAFLGRGADLRTLATRVADGARLISVHGIGGTGKTRLVTRFGWRSLGDFPGGVWFCDLSEARTVDGICGAVANALEVPLGADDPVRRLATAIAGRGRCLVMLDNFEQVARHAAETLGAWLDKATEATFVVTTREVLGLPGEHTLALAPLNESEAVALFVGRAQSANAAFRLSDQESRALASLVRLLDCLPLAIELAAARARVMPPTVLLKRMSERFKLLAATGARSSRQATMRGALDWSWDLLGPDEKAALAQLSVFEGGFTLDAAEGVLRLEHAWPIDAVQSLIDKSLVQSSGERMDLLVTVQEYAAERLGAERFPAEERHAAWFATLGTDEAVSALRTHGGMERRRSLRRDLDNVVAAIRRAVARDDGPTAVSCLRAAWCVLDLEGPYPLAVALSEQVLAMPRLAPRDRVLASSVGGSALRVAGRRAEAKVLFEAALASTRTQGDAALEAHLLGSTGFLAFQMGESSNALERTREGLALARSTGQRALEVMLTNNLGLITRAQLMPAEALALFEEAYTMAHQRGDEVMLAATLCNRGLALEDLGNADEARALYELALAHDRAIGHRQFEIVVLMNLHSLAPEDEPPAIALDRARSTLELAVALGDRGAEIAARNNVVDALCFAGRMEEARVEAATALELARQFGYPLQEGLIHGLRSLVDLRSGRLEDARVACAAGIAAAAAAACRPLLCTLHAQMAEIECRSGRVESAGEWLAKAEEFAIGERLHHRVERQLALSRRVLADAQYLPGPPTRAR